MGSLVARSAGEVRCLTDEELRDSCGIVVAFSQRSGGRSRPPFDSLNLAAHVGDDPAAVDENRARFMASLGIPLLRERLTMAEQVHGTTVRAVWGGGVGLGAFAREDGPPPVPATDALVTTEPDAPIMLCYADCVPVVLVAPGLLRGVAVIHAGWRGALAGVVAQGVRRLAIETGAEPAEMLAYIGPHIGPCHYEVDAERLSQFANAFGTIAAAQGRLDLGAVVSLSLNGVGVPHSAVCRADVCTAERTDAFYSYRAEGLTGRHGALACILGACR
jgi:YfiH family protein